MALTKEQFQKARQAGYTTEQIIGFEKKRESEPIKPMFSSPEEAAIGQEKAQRELRAAEQQTSPLGVISKGMRMASSPLENAMAAGIPDIISKKLTGKPYVDPDSQMKFLSEPAGMVAGLAGGSAVQAGKVILPVIQGGLKMSAKGIPTVMKDTISRKMGRGAITGGVGAGVQLSSDEEGNIDLGRQAGQGLLGAGIGAVAVPAGAVISKMGRAYKKWNYFRKNPKIPKSTELKSGIEKTKQEISFNAAERESGKREIEETFTTRLNNENRRLSENFDNLKSEYDEAGENGAVKFQDSTKFVLGDLSEGYGAHLGDIDDYLIRSGQQITKGELDSLFNFTSQNMNDNLMTSGHVVNSIKKMQEKYGIKMIGNQSRLPSAKTGLPIATTIRDNSNDVVNLQSFVKDIKDIKKGIKFGGSTEDNVALGIFYDDLTNYLGRRPGLEKYLELNQTYAPYINSAKMLVKQAKSHIGESNTVSSAKILKMFGLRKAGVSPTESGYGVNAADKSMVENIERLQQPSPFSKGMGTADTDPMIIKAQQLAQAKQATEEIGSIISAQKKSTIKSLDQKFVNELDNIMGSNKYIESDYILKKAMIEDALETRLKRIGYRDDQRRAIMQSKDMVGRLIRKLTGATATTSGTMYGAKAVGRALTGQ